MKKVLTEAYKIVGSIFIGYILGAFILIPSFLIIWLVWNWDAAVHLVSIVWCFSGLFLSLLMWNET